MTIIALCPLIVFGFYKNGINPFIKGSTGFIGMSKPIILLDVSLLGYLMGGIIRELFKKSAKGEKRSIINALKGNVVEAIILVAILPINTNYLVLFMTTFIIGLFLEKLKLNKIALACIAIGIINFYFGNNDFQNAYEQSTILNYNGVDLFFGMGTGGVFATNVFFILLGFIFLSFNKLYKKEMATSSLLTFLVLAITYKMVKGSYDEIFPLIFGYNILFSLVYIGPNLYSSSYTLKGQILSGIIIGIVTFLTLKFFPYYAAVSAILLVSLFRGILDRIFVIK